VQNVFIPELPERLLLTSQSFTLDEKYQPIRYGILRPSPRRGALWFWQRFKEMDQSGWCPAPACYAHVWNPVRRRGVWQLFVGFLSCVMYVDTEDGV
jgi:hypothetical protein